MVLPVDSRRSYLALWVVDILLLALGAILTAIQNVFVDSSFPDANGAYVTTAVHVGGWGAACLGAGVITLLVMLGLNAFVGGPLFIRERNGEQRDQAGSAAHREHPDGRD